MVSVALQKLTDINTSDKPSRLRAWAILNKMRKYTQNIEECEHCGKVFENGEDYWKDARNKCYCVDNACGWEDDDTSDSNCTIHDVSNLVCPTHDTKLYKHPNGLAYCSLCNYSIKWQTCC